jgi:pimeloyl-ACP methyl ester carboxylesterase
MQALFAPPKLVTAPLIDGFGTGAWDAMQHRTTALVQNDHEFTRPGLPLREREGGVDIFLRELADMIDQNGGRDRWSVTLVGHSMGAIVVNRMLDDYALLPVDRIVYLASATSIDDYKRTAVAYLRDHPKTEMYHVTLERHAEAFERFNGFFRVLFFDFVPRGSLLVWIDNLLSKPTTILERRVGRYSNLMRDIHDTPSDVAPRVYVMTFDFGPSVRKTQPQRITMPEQSSSGATNVSSPLKGRLIRRTA